MLRFIDGFDHYATADMGGKWTTVVTGTISTTTVHTAPGSLASTGTGISAQFTDTLGGNQATRGVGFWFYREGAIDRIFCAFRESDGTNHIGIRINADGTLSVVRGALNGAVGTTVLATSTNATLADTWYHIEFKATINNSTGAYKVHVNGSSTGWIPEATGVDTREGGTVGAANQLIIGGAGANCFFDDLYFFDDVAGDGFTDFKGVCEVVTRIASSGDGTHADFTPSTGTDNGAMVDDATPDGDTTYNASSTVGHRDSYNFSALGITGTIHGLQLNNWCRNSDAGARSVNGFYQSTSSPGITDGTNVVALSTSYIDVREPWGENPETTNAWTVSEIDAAEFGLEVQA
jgi:hypothetical protein